MYVPSEDLHFHSTRQPSLLVNFRDKHRVLEANVLWTGLKSRRLYVLVYLVFQMLFGQSRSEAMVSSVHMALPDGLIETNATPPSFPRPLLYPLPLILY